MQKEWSSEQRCSKMFPRGDGPFYVVEHIIMTRHTKYFKRVSITLVQVLGAKEPIQFLLNLLQKPELRRSKILFKIMFNSTFICKNHLLKIKINSLAKYRVINYCTTRWADTNMIQIFTDLGQSYSCRAKIVPCWKCVKIFRGVFV